MRGLGIMEGDADEEGRGEVEDSFDLELNDGDRDSFKQKSSREEGGAVFSPASTQTFGPPVTLGMPSITARQDDLSPKSLSNFPTPSPTNVYPSSCSNRYPIGPNSPSTSLPPLPKPPPLPRDDSGVLDPSYGPTRTSPPPQDDPAPNRAGVGSRHQFSVSVSSVPSPLLAAPPPLPPTQRRSFSPSASTPLDTVRRALPKPPSPQTPAQLLAQPLAPPAPISVRPLSNKPHQKHKPSRSTSIPNEFSQFPQNSPPPSPKDESAPSTLPVLPPSTSYAAGFASVSPYPTTAPAQQPSYRNSVTSRRALMTGAISAGGPTATPYRVEPGVEVCLECMMRDRDLITVDVSSPGVWARESDRDWEELLEMEREGEDISSKLKAGREWEGGGPVGMGKVAGFGEDAQGGEWKRTMKGDPLSEENLKEWTLKVR
jgi:hypothetical protein